MAKDADKIVVGQNGTVYVAPVATAAPTNQATALNAAFIDVGYVSEAGVTCTIGKEVGTIGAWQSGGNPIRRFVTSRNMRLAFELMEWKEWTLELATDGATADNSAEWSLTPPDNDDVVQYAVVVEWEDGANDFRLYLPRAIVTEDTVFNLTRTDAAMLPVTLEATVDADSDFAWKLFTDMASFDPDTE